MPEGLRMFPAYLRDAGYYTTNNSKKDYNAVQGKGVWDESSSKATWRNRKPGQPFFHMQSLRQHPRELAPLLRRKDGERRRRKPTPPRSSSPPTIPDTPTFRYTYATLPRPHHAISTTKSARSSPG